MELSYRIMAAFYLFHFLVYLLYLLSLKVYFQLAFVHKNFLESNHCFKIKEIIMTHFHGCLLIQFD